MNSPSIQPVNDTQSNWDIKKTLKAAYKPALMIASIGIALGAAASYFLAANEDNAPEASNYAMIQAPPSGAASIVQDAAQGALVLGHGFMGLAVAAWVHRPAQNPLTEDKHGLSFSVAKNMHITGAELIQEIKILSKTGTEEEILELLESENSTALTNEEKIEILSYFETKKYGPDFLKTAIELLDPIFNDIDFKWFQKLNAYENPPLFRAICERYKIRNKKILADFIYKEIENLQFMKHNPHFYDLSKQTTLILIEIHGKRILNSQEFFQFIKKSEKFLDLDFFKSLYNLGWESRFFNIPIDNHDQTLIHKLFRGGEVDFIKKLTKDIPLESIYLGDYFFLEELKECLENPVIEESIIKQEGNIFAQNGCRTIILTKTGQVLAIPGRDAKTFLPHNSLPTVTVYLNRGHASIAFAGGSHYGFYPEKDEGKNMYDSSYWKFSAASTPKKPLSPITSIFFGSAASPLLSIHCQVKDDFQQKTFSEEQNELKLDIYANEEQALAIQKHIEQMKKNCKDANAFYHLFSYNCIDFVREAVASADIEADVRDAFSQEELFRRPNLGTLYTIARSKNPTLLSDDLSSKITETAVQGILPLATASAVYLSGYAIRKISQGTIFVATYLSKKAWQGTSFVATYSYRKITRQ